MSSRLCQARKEPWSLRGAQGGHEAASCIQCFLPKAMRTDE